MFTRVYSEQQAVSCYVTATHLEGSLTENVVNGQTAEHITLLQA